MWSTGFIAQETREADDSGFMETTSLVTKRKGRGGKANLKTKTAQRRRNLQKAVYLFVQAVKNEDVYKDYFNPDPEVEKRLLELSDLVRCLQGCARHCWLTKPSETRA